MRSIYKRTIDNVIDLLTDTLSNNQRRIGGDRGWHQHIGTKKIGVPASAIALLHYKYLGKDCPMQEEVLTFIKSKQNQDGGWPYISNTQSVSNTESTCWALLALNEYQGTKETKLIDNGVEWLIGIKCRDKNDSGWPFVKGDEPRTYITCLVLRTLVKLGRSSCEEFESAKNWLKTIQHSDGGWGESPSVDSSTFFTSFAITTLLQCGVKKSDNTIEKAIIWLNKRLSSISIQDSSLSCYLEFIEFIHSQGRSRIPFFHYVLPHVVMAYLELDIKNQVVFDAIEQLTKKSENGIIEHPMLENSKITPIWALYDTTLALNRFRTSYSKWNKLYKFTVFRNKIFSLGKVNGFRLLVRLPVWLMKFIVGFMLSFVLFLIVYHFLSPFEPTIIQKWESLNSNSTGQLTISFLASVLFSVFSLIINALWNCIKALSTVHHYP